MTEQDARNHLYDLWQNGIVPNNFDENHSDYEKAVQYTIKNDQFDYEDFSNNNAIIKFGFWRVESDCLVGKGYYVIADSRFWETEEHNGQLVWSWLIHLAKKTWITKENVNDLNTAFFFCQDYFKKHKPKNLPAVSTAQTIYLQSQLLEIREEMNNYRKSQSEEDELKNMLKYRELKSNIKSL